MTQIRVQTIVFAVVLAAGRWAAASATSCAGAGDGTPCTGACIVDGACLGGDCIASQVAGDGTGCASGNRCSRGDYCLGGACQPGSDKVACPSPDSCHIGVCDPKAGCVAVLVCPPPEVTTVIVPPSSTPDLTPPFPIADLGSADAQPTASPDADSTPSATPHVLGSAVGACQLQAGTSGSGALAWLLLLTALLLTRRAAGSR